MSSLTGQTGLAGPTGQVGNKKPKGYMRGQEANYTPDQMQLFQQSMGAVSPDSYLSRLAGGDEDIFNQIEAPALKQFSGLQGNLASRFSGMGSGARRSSGFQNTMNTAASDFAQQLQSQRQSLQQGAIKDLHSMSQNLLGNKPYDTYLSEKPKPWWQELAMEFGRSGAKAGGKALFGGGGGDDSKDLSALLALLGGG